MTSLKDSLLYNKPKGPKKMFYQRLSMQITELEFKKQFKCLWVNLLYNQLSVVFDYFLFVYSSQLT